MNEILPFVTTYIEVEGIMLSEISQKEKYKYDMIFLCNLKIEKNNQAKNCPGSKIQRIDCWVPEGVGGKVESG